MSEIIPYINIDINRAANENRPFYCVDYYSLSTMIRDVQDDAGAAAEALREWKLRTGKPYHPSCPNNQYGGV